jgi:signal transduction histidine kinase
LGITVTKPFWMQRWFKVLVLLVLTGITIGLTRLVTMRNIRQEQRKLEVQKRIFAERERIARDLHDNVGAQISNIITGIEMYSLKQKTGSDDDPKLFYENIDLEARSAMTELRETIWLMDHRSLKLEDFVRQVRAYLAKTNSLSPDMAYRVLSEGNNQRELSSSLSMHLFRVIQEACNNTRKHAQARHFYVLFRLIKDNLKVIIEDDGKGMDLQSLPENGNGLKNMRNRMQEFSASFEISSKPGKGTRIEIILQIIP